MTRFIFVLPLAASACIFLNACTAQRTELGSAEHYTQITADKLSASDETVPDTLPLSLEDALDRAIAYNLDARVSALEALSKEDDLDLSRLQALPQFKLSGAYLGRSNEGASSSRSIVTGNQSLEPSFSTEQHHRTRELSLNWSTLDVLLAIAQSKSARDETQISHLRHEKVLQNIERDVVSAYWRAYAAQETEKSNAALLGKSDRYIDKLTRADNEQLLSATKTAQLKSEIYQQRESLESLSRELSYADIELKSLLSIPQNAHLVLTTKPKNPMRETKDLIAENTESLEQEALYNRPEIQETVLQKNIDAQSTRNEIIKTLPGAQLFFALNKDTNKFLYESEWASFSGTIAQNITALFTAPVRYRASKNIEELGEARRISLVAAIMTQVHLSHHRLNAALDEYKAFEISYAAAKEQARAASAQREAGMASGQNDIPAQIQAQSAKLRSLQAQADVFDAYAQLRNTLGRSSRNAGAG